MVVGVTELVENKGTYTLVRICVVCVCVIICLCKQICLYSFTKYHVLSTALRHKDVCVNGIGSFAYGQLSI